MRQFCTLITTILLCNIIYAQDQSISDGNIYAVIIGISDYADEEIGDLSFANRDAEIFAEYLMSDAGGKVPKENIKLLTNQNATLANIYNAKDWLEKTALKDDLVFFYFSGHGDVESSLYKLGFLLAYDTPNKNFLNNAVSIEHINIMANQLSVVKEAKVILITDACHSGKVASSNRGKALVGDQLSKVTSKEIRIASCGADEKSQEDTAWGGGRGAFSYYLINGMKGLADQPDDDGDTDGEVTLGELKTYLETQVPKDVKKIKRKSQVPLVEGKSFTLMSFVDDNTLKAVKEDMNRTDTATGARMMVSGGERSGSIEYQAVDRYLSNNHLNATELESLSTFYLDKNEEEIIEDFIERYTIDEFATEEDKNWYHSLKNDSIARETLKYKLAAKLHDQVQKDVNAYLVGDKDELARRQYYNSKPEEFTNLSNMLEVGKKLVDSKMYLYEIMDAKSHYFKGIAARLSIFSEGKLDSFYQISLQEQKAALAINDQAAYVHNELGILYKIQKDYPQSIISFNKAIELSPTWALPYANLGNLYYAQEEYQKGLEYGNLAISMQPDYHNAYNSAGKNAANIKNLLYAEECFIKAIQLNDKHYLPYEEIAHIYLEETKYAEANQNFYEAEARKQGLSFLGLVDTDADGILDLLDMESDTPPSKPCEMDSTKIDPKDILANTAYGYYQYQLGNKTTAKKYLHKAVNIQPSNPIAYRYLGAIEYEKMEWMAAEKLFRMAQDNYMDQDQYNQYIDILSQASTYRGCDLKSMLPTNLYQNYEVDYYLADIYTTTKNYSKARDKYIQIMEEEEQLYKASYLLWNLYEIQNQYIKAENTIIQLANKNSKAKVELYAFYQRMIEREINITTYEYKAGTMLYSDLIPNKPLKVTSESPDEEDILVGSFVDLDMMPETPLIPGTGKKISVALSIDHPENNAIEHFENIKDNTQGELKGEVLYMLGDLYNYKEDYHQGEIYYAEASKLLVDHASIREKLTTRYTAINEFMKAYDQMDELRKRDQISFELLKQFTAYNIYAGQYAKSDTTHREASYIYPIPDPTLEEYQALRYMLSDQQQESIKKYKSLLEKYGDSQANIHYTLTRLYCSIKDKKKALKHLSLAIDYGFNYNWVVDFDPALSLIAETAEYSKLRAKLPASNL